jgi:type IV pilus assembly protein PilV
MFPRKMWKIQKIFASQGLTLIEVLIALAVFSIGVLAIGSMQIKAINGNASARMQTEATAYAVDRVERLLALPYDDPNLDELNNPHQAIDESYTIVWNVTDDVPINDTKTIKISVIPANPNARTVSLSFIKGQGS